jgi:radical SAM superfamily enzyme YgiQ (UPF0313 family)
MNASPAGIHHVLNFSKMGGPADRRYDRISKRRQKALSTPLQDGRTGVGMKILLVALNAKYIHSNLAVYSLKAYAAKYAEHIGLVEMTVNHSEEDVLKTIYLEKADVVAFSCYIWNIGMVLRISKELKKVQPEVKLWFGGPEVSYDAEKLLKEYTAVDGIVIGEGEQTFLELAGYYIERKTSLKEVAGIAFKAGAEVSPDKPAGEEIPGYTVTVTAPRLPIALDSIPFPYEKPEVFQNRIIYYESSRGCPFSCSYCLSSVDKRVRFRSAELVKRELKLFLDYRVSQVKFVDRTFNCNRKHAMDIWRFIKENDNGITNFHFEISADLLEEEELDFLAALRPGQVQLEIGVQSTNQDTVRAIRRETDFGRLSRNVARIREGGNIHQHLDLIAGLPREDYTSFEKSFRDVYALRPDQLQLGFLKILKGSFLEEESKTYGISYRDAPPYEVLFTDSLTYEEVLKIKGVCEMLEIYYNSGQFTYSVRYLEHYFISPMRLYLSLNELYESKKIAELAHSRIKRYEILLDFFREKVLESIPDENKIASEELFTELLVFDLYLREDLKARPAFYRDNPGKGSLKELYGKYRNGRRSIHIEQFRYDVIASAEAGQAIRKDCIILFDYGSREPLNKAAEISVIGG